MKKFLVVTAVVLVTILSLLSPADASSLESRVTELEEQIASLQAQVELLTLTTNWALESVLSLEEQIATIEQNQQFSSLKVAYLSEEDAFSVFTDAVSDLRQLAVDKQGAITKLQQQYMASTISKDEYDSQYKQLQVELLQAQLNIDMVTIDKMIASPGFSDMKSDLQLLKDEAQPVVDEMNNLVSTVCVGVIDATEFENRYTQVKNAFSQLDQLLTQAATGKIVQAANEIAARDGYDLVLRAKNVIVYRNTGKITDITKQVKREIASYLR
jgi:chromosome segregation ATPase